MNPLFYSSLLLKKPVATRNLFARWTLFWAALVLIGLVLSASAQAQTAQWVKQMGLGGISNGVSTDAAGNAYATGLVSNPGLFDSLVIPCNASDVFLAKYNTAGDIQWANVGGGELLDQGNEVVTDAAGNSYVVGAIQTNSLHPTAQFDNITLTGNGDYDWLIVKYNATGQVVWARNYGGTQGDFGDGVALDGTGSLYVTGFFNGTMTVQGVTVTSKGLFDVFLAKMDANGTLLWLRTAGGTGSDQAHGVVVDGLGNVGLAGEFQNTATFGTHSVKAAGLGDAFVAKYDPAGNNLWVHGGGSTTSFAGDPAKAIAVDGANNCFITGDYTGTATFDACRSPTPGRAEAISSWLSMSQLALSNGSIMRADRPPTKAIASASTRPATAG